MRVDSFRIAILGNSGAALLALASGAAAAAEFTDFPIPPSVLTRAQVLEELAQARRDAPLQVHGEATEFPRPVALLQRSRAEVIAESRLSASQPDRAPQARELALVGG